MFLGLYEPIFSAPMRNLSSLVAAFGIALTLAACSSQDDGGSPESVPPTTNSGTGTEDPITGTGGPTSGGSSGAVGGGGTPGPDLANVQKRKAQMLTSFWENDTTVFQYAFSRNNNDGYGYTSGRVGFTTATGDSSEVVDCFVAAYTGTGNLMKKYAAALKALRDKMLQSGQMQPNLATIDAIGNYNADWTATANSAVTGPAFNGCQDERVDLTYWAPTLPIMKKWGLSTALTRASIYDAMVVHGEDSVNNLAKQANSDTGNGAQKAAVAALAQTAESEWLKAFHIRRVALLNSSTAWRPAIARGANYEQMRRDGNFAFTAKIVTSATANTVFPGNNYPSNGYQACVINPDGTVSGVAQCTAPVSN